VRGRLKTSEVSTMLSGRLVIRDDAVFAGELLVVRENLGGLATAHLTSPPN